MSRGGRIGGAVGREKLVVGSDEYYGGCKPDCRGCATALKNAEDFGDCIAEPVFTGAMLGLEVILGCAEEGEFELSLLKTVAVDLRSGVLPDLVSCIDSKDAGLAILRHGGTVYWRASRRN